MKTGRDSIVVIGARGNQGGAVARELLAGGHVVKAMTRQPESEGARALADLGAQVVQADMDDAASLERVFEGTWGVFAMQNTWEAGVEREEEQGKRTAEVAKRAGVQHFVYTSVGSAQRQTGIPHFDNKFRVEEFMCGLDFPSCVIIRPVFFMENFLSPWFKPGIDDGKLMMAVKSDTVLQMIAVRDIGKYGRQVFERHEELNGRTIDIASDEMTMPEAATIIGNASGKEVAFVPVPIEEVRKMSEDFAIMLEWFDRVGYDADIAGNAKEYGIQPSRLAEWAATAAWS